MKRILLCIFAFLFITTASIGGVLLAQNSAGGGIDNSVSESVTTTADAPTYTDYYWTDEGNYATSFAGGSGTESDPYLISTAAQLAYLAYRVNFNSQTYSDTYFKQTANIDLSAYYWDAIGYSSSYYFRGHYDGGGYTISGLYTQSGSDDNYSYQGLFGYVYGTSSSYATISNVSIINSNIQGYRYVGAIVGYVSQYATISNCYNTGTVSGTGILGGVVGYNYISSYVYNCYNTGSVTGSSSSVGGVVGYNYYRAYVYNSYNTGSVTGNGNSVGGVVGYNVTSSYIYNCYNTGTVSGSTYVGGVVGYNRTSSYVYNCYNTGTVSGSTYVGGVVGYNYGTPSSSPYVYNSYNTGSVSGSGDYVGGVVGYNNYSYVYNCYYGGDCENIGGINGSDSDGSAEYLSTIVSSAKTTSWYTSTSSSTWNSSYPWDFDDVWILDSDINDGYPALRAFVYTINYYYRNSSGTATYGTKNRYMGESFTTPSSSTYSYYTSNGWSLAGWAASSSSTSATYSAGAEVSDYNSSTDTLSFYAIASRTIQITYNANAGSDTVSNLPSSQSATQNWNMYGGTTSTYITNYSLTISSTQPTRTGYTFQGWATSSTGTASYASGATVSFAYNSSASVTLYAVWIQNTAYYYRDSSGNLTSTTQERTYGSSFTTLSSVSGIYSSNGWSLIGWSTSDSSTSITSNYYSTNTSVSAYNSSTSQVVLYAIASRTIQITYNANAGSDTVSNLPSSQSATQYWNMYGGTTSTYITNYSLTISSTQPTRSGYTFLGWSTNSLATTADSSYAGGTTVNFGYNTSNSITLYAVWEPNVPAYYDNENGYWYIEYGYMPQTKVTDSTTITALGSATTGGGTYYFAGESYTAVVYNDNEYCYILENWYLVEPIRWIIYSANELTSGSVVQVSTAGFDYYMVTASVVDVGAFADSYVGLESGYSTTNSYVTNFQENISGYLGEFNADVQTFGTSGTTSSSTSAYIFLSSAEEIQNALGTMGTTFSDLVLDYLSSVGSYYFTRDLGTNLNNIYVYSRAGSQTQKLATSVYGMRFTVKFTEFVCIE